MENILKTYPAPWEGQLILACRKCQRKLKHDRHLHALAKLKKVVKRHKRKHNDRAFKVINVPCMSLCPAGGVTVCDPRNPGRFLILRGEKDIDRLDHLTNLNHNNRGLGRCRWQRHSQRYAEEL